MRILRWSLATFFILAIGWQGFLYSHRLSFVPDEMQVIHILFAEEEAWGFGPGGNESGFIMYALPEKIADKVTAEGIAYLSSFPSARLGKPHGWQGKYNNWQETPITLKESSWFQVPASDDVTASPELYNYLDRYGFAIPMPSNLEKLFNQVIKTPGNFYAYGRIGVIVVAPSIRKVFYLYAG